MSFITSAKDFIGGAGGQGGIVSGLTSGVTYLIYIGIVSVFIGVIAYILIMYFKYNQKIIIFENISGAGYQPTGKDKATIVKIGKGGMAILYLLKRKVYRPAYGKRMGKNTYWFAVAEDGYWHNVTLGDLDKKLAQLGVDPVEKEMKYQYTALEQTIKDRYDKPSFWDKYGNYIVTIIPIVIICVFIWLMFDKFLMVAGSANEAVAHAGEVMEATKELIGALDSLRATGGLAPAG